VRRVAMTYTIPYTIGRGYSSLPPRKAVADRFAESGKENLILIVLCDFDPEGEDIGHSFARSLRDDFGVGKVQYTKAALTADQVREMRLPPQMRAKKKSSRYEKFSDLHGDDVFELDAIPPDQLEQILTAAVQGVLDMDAFREEERREGEDAAQIERARSVV